MSEGAPERKKRRFLVEVRGMLHIDAYNGEEADRAVEAWIVGVGRGEAAVLPDGARVGYLRIYPETEESPGWSGGRRED